MDNDDVISISSDDPLEENEGEGHTDDDDSDSENIIDSGSEEDEDEDEESSDSGEEDEEYEDVVGVSGGNELHRACRLGDVEAVERLLGNEGGQVETTDAFGQTPPPLGIEERARGGGERVACRLGGRGERSR